MTGNGFLPFSVRPDVMVRAVPKEAPAGSAQQPFELSPLHGLVHVSVCSRKIPSPRCDLAGVNARPQATGPELARNMTELGYAEWERRGPYSMLQAPPFMLPDAAPPMS